MSEMQNDSYKISIKKFRDPMIRSKFGIDDPKADERYTQLQDVKRPFRRETKKRGTLSIAL